MTVTITDKEIEKAVIAYAEEYLGKLSAAPDTHVFSERYEKRRAQIVAFGASPMRRSRRRRTLRSAVAAVLVLLLSLGMIISFSATARAAVLNWLKETYNNIIRYEFIHQEDDHTYVICDPARLPDGFERIETTRVGNHTLKVYKNAQTGEYLRFEYDKATDPMIAEVQKQSAGAEVLIHAGSIIKYCLEGGNNRRIFWYDQNRQLVFFVDSNLSREALADSIGGISLRLPLYEPTWLPEGYEEVERINVYPWVDIVWQNNEDKMLIVDYVDMSEVDSINIWSRGDEVESEAVFVAGCSGLYYPSSERDPGDGLVWIDEEKRLVFIVSSESISKEMLIEFANSIICTEADW